jgi:mRNA-degrading endonuclease toxin of MazEF toxin-antitoxin module
MALPEPEPGLVIRYAYLWRREAEVGREHGVKDRPCVVVLAVKRDGAKTRVVVAPVTHTPSANSKTAMELPAQTKKRLGLDEQASWIVTEEVNVFTWPGPDLKSIDTQAGRRFAFGYLPSNLTRQLIAAIRRHASEGTANMVHRSE